MFITNAFSLQMLGSEESKIEIRTVSRTYVRYMSQKDGGLVSAIGHADTAAVVSAQLGTEFPANRVNIQLAKGDRIIVAQLTGGRLPEGATTLPQGFKISYKLVTVDEY